MKKQLFPLCIALSISACASTTTEVDTAAQETALAQAETQPRLVRYDPADRYAELLWVAQANPIADARQALTQGDTRLWAYNSRYGAKIPGISADAMPAVLQKYQLRMAAAMGDSLHGARHLELQLQFVEYAKKYNHEIMQQQ